MSDDLTIPDPAFRGKHAGRYGTGQGRVGQGMDPDTRRLMLFAGGLGAILSILIATSALVGHRRTDVPVITADPRPIRIKPDNPGGLKIDGADSEIFSGALDSKNARLSATAESPDTMALRDTGAPPPRAPEALRQTIADPSPATASASIQPRSATAAQPQPAQPQPAQPQPSQSQPSQSQPSQSQPAQPKAAVVASSLPAQPKTAVAASPPAAKPVAAKPSAAAPVKPAAAPLETHASAANHQAMVQLAALTSEEAAHIEWQQLLKRMPDLLNGHQPHFSRTDRDGRTFWRVRTAGFVDLAQARGFCDHVRAKGGGCSAAEF